MHKYLFLLCFLMLVQIQGVEVGRDSIEKAHITP